MKALGVILILAASVLIALLKNSSLQRRCRELESFCCFLRIVNDGCKYSRNEVADIISNISESSLSTELSFVRMLREKRVSGQGIIDEVFSKLNETEFSQEDREHIIDFFTYLGTTAREGQIENCNRHLDYFEQRFENEKQQLPTRMKTFSSLSFCGCAAAVLILI